METLVCVTTGDLSRAKTLIVFMHLVNWQKLLAHLPINVGAQPRLIPSLSSLHLAVAAYPVSASPLRGLSEEPGDKVFSLGALNQATRVSKKSILLAPASP